MYILLWLWAVFLGSDKCNTAWANNLKLSGLFTFAGLGGRDEVKCEVYVSRLSLSSSDIYDRHREEKFVYQLLTLLYLCVVKLQWYKHNSACTALSFHLCIVFKEELN